MQSFQSDFSSVEQASKVRDMKREDSLYGIFALVALRLCQMGCIGPHLPFDAIALRDMIGQNSAPLAIGQHERRFLTVLANCIEEDYPNCQSVWSICEAAGEFIRGLDDPNRLESVYALVTRFNSDADGAEAENMMKDGKIEVQVETKDMTRAEKMEEEEIEDGKVEIDRVGDEGSLKGRVKERKLISTVVVCIQEFRSNIHLN